MVIQKIIWRCCRCWWWGVGGWLIWPCRSKRMAVISLMTSAFHLPSTLHLFFIPDPSRVASSVANLTFSSFSPQIISSLTPAAFPSSSSLFHVRIFYKMKSLFGNSQSSKHPSEELYCLNGIWFCWFQSWSETPWLLWQSKAPIESNQQHSKLWNQTNTKFW